MDRDGRKKAQAAHRNEPACLSCDFCAFSWPWPSFLLIRVILRPSAVVIILSGFILISAVGIATKRRKKRMGKALGNRLKPGTVHPAVEGKPRFQAAGCAGAFEPFVHFGGKFNRGF